MGCCGRRGPTLSPPVPTQNPGGASIKGRHAAVKEEKIPLQKVTSFALRAGPERALRRNQASNSDRDPHAVLQEQAVQLSSELSHMEPEITAEFLVHLSSKRPDLMALLLARLPGERQVRALTALLLAMLPGEKQMRRDPGPDTLRISPRLVENARPTSEPLRGCHGSPSRPTHARHGTHIASGQRS